MVSVRCFASFWWSFRSCKVLPSFSFQILPVFRCLVRSLCPDVSPAGLRVKSAGCLPRRARPCFCFEPPASLAWPVRSPCLGTRPRALLLTKDLTDASSSQLGTYDVAVSDAGPSRYIPCPDLPDHSHHGWTFAGRLPIPPPSRSSLSTNHGHLPPRSTQNRCFLTGPAFEGIQPPLSALKSLTPPRYGPSKASSTHDRSLGGQQPMAWRRGTPAPRGGGTSGTCTLSLQVLTSGTRPPGTDAVGPDPIWRARLGPWTCDAKDVRPVDCGSRQHGMVQSGEMSCPLLHGAA